jgi:aspartate-alanine antiporter
MLHAFFERSPLIPLFLSIAMGYGVGRIRIGNFRLGGLAGTLFSAILIGQVGVPSDPLIKTFAFALFIYALGFSSGPQFFGSLGRKTFKHVHLAVFSSLIIFLTIWGVARTVGLDKGTAAGLLAGAITESACIGTAGEALRHIGLSAGKAHILETNIAVTYAITYLIGLFFVVFYASWFAPRLLKTNLKKASKDIEKSMGTEGESLSHGQWYTFERVISRIYEVTEKNKTGITVETLEKTFDGHIAVQCLLRQNQEIPIESGLVLKAGDRVSLTGKREDVVKAGKLLGAESEDFTGMNSVQEIRDIVVTSRKLNGVTLRELREKINPNDRHGVFAVKLIRSNKRIGVLPWTTLQMGDVLTLVGSPEKVESAAKTIGYLIEPSDNVDYIYLGLGIITGIFLGMAEVSIMGSPISLGVGGGCLISGLFFGWLRGKYPIFGTLPSAAAVHMRDFGLAIFVACIGLAAGPHAFTLIKNQGLLLPFLAMVVITIPLTASTLYARFVLKMNPVMICGALAGLFTCTPALNAVVTEAKSEIPVLGYTVPYAIANVLLTLLGPVIIFTV